MRIFRVAVLVVAGVAGGLLSVGCGEDPFELNYADQFFAGVLNRTPHTVAIKTLDREIRLRSGAEGNIGLNLNDYQSIEVLIYVPARLELGHVFVTVERGSFSYYYSYYRDPYFHRYDNNVFEQWVIVIDDDLLTLLP